MVRRCDGCYGWKWLWWRRTGWHDCNNDEIEMLKLTIHERERERELNESIDL